jgi:hypothetical protein
MQNNARRLNKVAPTNASPARSPGAGGSPTPRHRGPRVLGTLRLQSKSGVDARKVTRTPLSIHTAKQTVKAVVLRISAFVESRVTSFCTEDSCPAECRVQVLSAQPGAANRSLGEPIRERRS